MAQFPAPQPMPHPGPPPFPPELPEGIKPEDRRPPWAPWTAPVALVSGFAVALIGAVLIAAAAGAFGADLDDPPPGILIASTYFQDIVLVVVALVFARLGGRPQPWQFGLRKSPLWSTVGWLVVAWVAFIAFSAIWALIVGSQEADDLPQELGAKDSTGALVAVAILVTVLAPIAEEIFFRGYFFGALRNWKGLWPAAIITGIVFGAIHAGSADAVFLLPLAVFGFILCLLYARTRSLYPAIVLHALNNSLALGVALGWDWQIPLLMVGSNVVIALVLLPFTRMRKVVWG